MAFDYTNLYPDTSGNGGYTKAWNYTTVGDSIAVCSASGYFNKVASRVGIGDNITIAVVNAFPTSARTTLVEYATLFVNGISGGIVTTVNYMTALDASPAFTGTPTAPTAAVDTNTTQLATAAFVLAQAASATPLIDAAVAVVGTSTRFARGDHVHPTDTTRAALASPTFTGVPAAPTAAVDTNTTQLATTAMVLAQAAAATPLVNGVAAVGTATRFARADHVHPTDRPGRNILINSDFRINQRAYVSAAVLAAGIYGHDRWKAGASGGDYSFTQLKSSTQITIAANKTLIQVVEDANVIGGNYVLSWTGTCLARYAINSATPAGSYAASPILITGQTAGTVMSVEFGNAAASGTLGTVQLEAGTIVTTFEYQSLPVELAKAQRYFEVISAATNASAAFSTAQAASTSRAVVTLTWKVTKRVAPTGTVSVVTDWGFYNTSIGALIIWSTFTPNLADCGGMFDVTTATAGLGGAGTATLLAPANANARIFINAEL